MLGLGGTASPHHQGREGALHVRLIKLFYCRLSQQQLFKLNFSNTFCGGLHLHYTLHQYMTKSIARIQDLGSLHMILNVVSMFQTNGAMLQF